MIYLAHQGPLDSWLPKPSHRPPQSLPHQEPTPQYPPSAPKPLSPAVCPPLQGPGVSGSGHMVQETEEQANRETGRIAVCQGEDRSRKPTLQEALSEILGAYQHSQDTMVQILDNMQENRWLQEGQYQGIWGGLQAINNTLISIAGVLADMANIMRKAVSHQRAPATSQSSEQPSTPASGEEACHRTHRPSATPPPQKVNPPTNVPCDPDRSQTHLPRPPPGNETLLIVPLVSHSDTLSTLNCHCPPSYVPLDNASVL
ncbi:hypothetical protein NDU88_005507 [Pleurodeles waltl]|uniref:Uncharacterized protein n=1 Tax=Pleurodeles waltl TaxID=8319 RepID=A0AAV7N638_PLEWA|nr:hypothetical protein NDU88_005507 [Pleurodeles waltl]